jgi:hypothetical protein
LKLHLTLEAYRAEGALLYVVTDGEGKSLGVVKSLRSQVSPAAELEKLTLVLDDAPADAAADKAGDGRPSKKK